MALTNKQKIVYGVSAGAAVLAIAVVVFLILRHKKPSVRIVTPPTFP